MSDDPTTPVIKFCGCLLVLSFLAGLLPHEHGGWVRHMLTVLESALIIFAIYKKP